MTTEGGRKAHATVKVAAKARTGYAASTCTEGLHSTAAHVHHGAAFVQHACAPCSARAACRRDVQQALIRHGGGRDDLGHL